MCVLWMLWAKLFLQSAACVFHVYKCVWIEKTLHWMVCACFGFIILGFIIFTFQILCRLLIGHLEHLLHNYWKNESNKSDSNFSITLSSPCPRVINVYFAKFIYDICMASGNNRILSLIDCSKTLLQKLSQKKVGRILYRDLSSGTAHYDCEFPGKILYD